MTCLSRAFISSENASRLPNGVYASMTAVRAVSQQPEQDEVSRMGDFKIIRERQNLMTALAELTDRYRRLNTEMSRRETLRWMVAP
jgi:hypothetical protein